MHWMAKAVTEAHSGLLTLAWAFPGLTVSGKRAKIRECSSTPASL